MTMLIPNFRDRHALILHREDHNRDALMAQLARLGVRVSALWPAEAVTAAESDVLFFDADMGFDGLFAWKSGKARIPLIALLGSEAPGRIEWMLAQEPCAYLAKPIGSTGAFSALSIAFHNFALKQTRDEALRQIGLQHQIRGAVLRAAAALMKRHDLDPGAALGMLRSESMRRRLPLEAVSALVLDGKWLPGARGPRRPATGQDGKRATSG
jgi:AmiR/NasT family two-component response regulator